MSKSLTSLSCTGCVFFCAVFLMLALPMAEAASQPQVAVIDNASRVTLAHSTHPSVTIAHDLGRVNSNLRIERMMLVLGPSPQSQPALQSFIDSLHDRKSANYHRWLTPEQFGENFGPAQADVTKIAAWLQQQGFDGVKISKGRSHIEFSGNVQSVENTFQTEIHSYELEGETYLSNNHDISIPKALSGVVQGVNLQNFSLSQPLHTPPVPVKRNLATGQWIPANPQSSFNSPTLIDPNDFAQIYDLNRVYDSGINGAGVTIAVVSRTTAVQMSDIETFREAYHLPLNDPNVIMNGGPTVLPGYGVASSDAQESTLDLEWAGAIAPGATIDQVISGVTLTTDGVDLSTAYIVDNNLGDIMTLSFGECEADLGTARNSFFNAIFEQAAAQGISVFVATGDSGAAGCDSSGAFSATGGIAVSGLASTPFETAVGGTEFDEGGNTAQYWNQDGVNQVPLGYIPETVWNESATYNTLYGSGGGISTIYSQPSWQSTSITGVASDGFRELPDVSMTAALHDGYVICFSPAGECTTTSYGDQSLLYTAYGVGGTSASVQVFGAIMALVDQKQGGRQGLANYGLYRLAANETYAGCNSSNQTNPSVPPPCVFNDITAGSNGVPGNDTYSGIPVLPGQTAGQLGYNATQGYDPATGLGSVDAYNLINAWNSLGFAQSVTALSASTSTTIQHGQPVTFSISVAAGSGSAVPTGSVGLIAQTNAPFSTGIGVGGGTLVNGVFSGSFNTLPGGQYNVVAHYAGDSNFAPSVSNPIPVNVAAEASSITIIGYGESVAQPLPSPISLGYGDPFVVVFQVTSASGAGIPTGTVTVFDGGQAIAQARVSNQGYTTLTNCQSAGFCLGFGTHTLTASYSGDAGLNSSTTSQPFVYNIVKGKPIASFEIFGSGAGLLFGFNFVQNYLPVFPTGTLTVSDHIDRTVTPLRTYQLNGNPIVDDFVALLSSDVQWFFMEYSGDANYLPATFYAGFFDFPASGIPTQITITPLTSPIIMGQPVSLKATVTSSQANGLTPTGYIFWYSANAFLNPNLPNALTDGTTTIQSIMPNSGPIMAEYGGDANFADSAAVLELNQSTSATPTVSVSSNLSTSTPGEQVTLTAAINPPPETSNPTGYVQFFDALNGAAPVALGARQPTSAFSGPYFGTTLVPMPTNLPLGTNVITASYTGDNNFSPVPATASIPTTVTVVQTLPTNPVSPNFGSVNVGKASGTQSVNVLFTGSGTLNAINVLTQGAINSSFELVDGGTCVTQTPFSAGQSCMVDVTFAPVFAGTSMGAVVLADANGNVLGKQYIVGQGIAAQIAFDYGSPTPVQFSGSVTLSDPEFLTADGSGNLYIADNGNQRVLKVLPPGCNLTNSCQTVVASSANGLGAADGVAVDGAGNIFVSDSFRNQVVAIPPGCTTIGCAQIIASQAGGQISTPRELAVDGAGDLFIADLNNNRVVEVPAGCTTGGCQIALGTGLGPVYGVAVDGDGNVFISDSGNGQVVKLPAGCTGGSCQSTVTSGLAQPKGIALDAAGNLYITESTQVLEVSAASGDQLNLTAGAMLPTTANLVDVAIGPGGTLFIADAGDSLVSRLDRGIPPSVQFTNSPTPYGTATAAQPVTVENIGTQPLNLQTIEVMPPAALDPGTTTCTNGEQVATGASCQLGVQFAPTQLTGFGASNFLQGNILLVDNTLNQLYYTVSGDSVVQRAATQTIFVNGIAGNNQIITFPALPTSVVVGASPLPLQATSSSGLPITYFVSGPGSIQGSTLAILAAGTITVTATQAGNASFQPATPVSQTITVTSTTGTSPGAKFTIASNSPSLTVSAGKSGTAIITVTPSGGFNSQISFSCNQQSLVSCSFQPSTLGPVQGTMSTTLQVTASSAAAQLRSGDRGTPLALASGTLLFGIAIVIVPFDWRRKCRTTILGLLAVVVVGLLALSAIGCGSSSVSSKPTVTATPQTTTLTVTASGGNVVQSVSLSITLMN